MLVKNRIKELRRSGGISIRELARWAKIHYTRLNMAENGKYLLSDQEFERLCRVLGCDPTVVYPDLKVEPDIKDGWDLWQSLKRM